MGGQRAVLVAVVSLSLGGCAGLQFNPQPEPDALTYNEPVPYLLVSTTKECVTTATVVSVPGRKRSVAFRSGYGTADLSVNLQNGIITSVNQKTDTKIPETINAIASLSTSLGLKALAESAGKQIICKPVANLYEIVDGRPSRTAIAFPVTTEIVNAGAVTK